MATALSGTASAEPTADDWYRLRVCESGNNYAINTGNGYYGAYQFDLGTWRSVGGTGSPNQASPAVQDALALTLYRQRGWSPWACARILGLPVRPDVIAAPAPPPPVPPIGSLDAVKVSGTTATVGGWVLDRNAAANSIQVHIYVNGAGHAFVANKSRPDVNAAMGVTGQHGFTEAVPLQSGSNNVCAYAIGVTSNNNSLIGCRTVRAVMPARGTVDSMSVSGWNVTVSGWAFDPNSPAASNQVHLYIGRSGAAATVANRARPDVNSVVGIPGQHGFSVTGRLNRGANSVCAFSIATGAGSNTLIQCRTIQGPVLPVGRVDSVRVSGSQAIVAGWVLDPNSPATSVPVHIYVNNAGRPFTANGARPDVNAVLGVSGRHGYSQSVPLTVGVNNVCVYAIGVASNNNALIQCRNVTYNGVQAQAQQRVAAAPAATEQSVAAQAAKAPAAGVSSPATATSVESSTAPAAPAPAPVAPARSHPPRSSRRPRRVRRRAQRVHRPALLTLRAFLLRALRRRRRLRPNTEGGSAQRALRPQVVQSW